MARQPKVTRTVKVTIAKVLCLNLETKEPFEKEVRISRAFKDESKLMKRIEEVVNDATTKAILINSAEVEDILYGMTEQKFIENAEIMEHR